MIQIIVISVLVLTGNKAFGLKQCNDCMVLRSCPAATEFAEQNSRNEAMKEKFRQSFCGTEIVDGQKLPKICCSAFGDYGNRFGPDVSPEDNLETHPNIGLLPESCGSIDGKRIVGGTIAGIHEFPWMALISHKTRAGSGKGCGCEFKCGGSILNNRYVLTAAHCVHNKKIAGVRIGEFNLYSQEDCQGIPPNVICESKLQDMPVEKEIIHENYQFTNKDNDIALLRLKNPIDLTLKNAKPICLPIQGDLRNLDTGNQTATVAGWGLTENGTTSGELRKVNIPIHTASECQRYYGNPSRGRPELVSNVLCAGEQSKDSCNGDSGGPLMLERTVNGRFRLVQYGVVSFGPVQCGSTYPGVYSDVTKYVKWILDNIKP